MEISNKRLEERIWQWKEEAERKLQKRWWLWLIILVIALFEERLLKSTNEFLDTKVGPMSDIARATLVYVPSSPVVVAFLLGVAVIVGLTAHAYFDTRNKGAGAKNSRSGAKEYWNPPAYVGLVNLGRRIEAAVFAGPTGKADVKPVIEVLRDGEEIAVNQYELCGGQDPSYGREKFLTVTYSETLREGSVYVSPSRWLRETSNALERDQQSLNQISQRQDITVMIGDVTPYRSTVMSTNNRSGNIQRVYFTIIFSLRNAGNETTFDVGGLKVKVGKYEKEARLVTLSGRSYISRELWIPHDIEPITHHMLLPSGHGVTRYVVFDGEFDISLVDAIEAVGTFQLTIVTDSTNPANRVITAEKHLMPQALTEDAPKPLPLE